MSFLSAKLLILGSQSWLQRKFSPRFLTGPLQLSGRAWSQNTQRAARTGTGVVPAQCGAPNTEDPVPFPSEAREKPLICVLMISCSLLGVAGLWAQSWEGTNPPRHSRSLLGPLGNFRIRQRLSYIVLAFKPRHSTQKPLCFLFSEVSFFLFKLQILWAIIFRLRGLR